MIHECVPESSLLGYQKVFKKSPKKKSRSKYAGTRPMNPGQATERIREIAVDDKFSIWWTDHSKERMLERDLIAGDVHHVLKRGFVYENGEPATVEGLFKYAIQSTTPNSPNRDVRVVVIPEPGKKVVKIVTVMWADEN